MDILEMIAKVEAEQLQEVLDAVMQRYDELYPNWEAQFFSVPKDADRNAHINQIIQMLQGFKHTT